MALDESTKSFVEASWIPDFPAARSSFALGFFADRFLMICGGQLAGLALRDCHYLDVTITAPTWATAGAVLLQSRADPCSVAFETEELWVAGGWEGMPTGEGNQAHCFIQSEITPASHIYTA